MPGLLVADNNSTTVETCWEMTQSSVNGHESELPHLNLSYDNSRSYASALELVFQIQPKWRENPELLKITKFTDGITNTLLKISRKTPGMSPIDIDLSSILMRAYGNQTELIIDRDREARSHELCASMGLAPPLLARFRNGLLYGYIPGTVCTAEDLTDRSTWRAVARRLGEWHALLPVSSDAKPQKRNSYSSIPRRISNAQNVANGGTGHFEANPLLNAVNGHGPITGTVWNVIQKWLDVLPCETPKEKARRSALQKELDRSIAELNDGQGPGRSGMVLGHGDLLCANVIILPDDLTVPVKKSERSVTFIDYEYAMPCPAAFDIANHFAEWAGYDCDYSMLPTRNVRRAFLQEYLSSYDEHTNHIPSPSFSRVDDLMDQVDRYRGMPGLYWGIWSLIQAQISQIKFDYASYAESRLGEYWAWRGEESGSRQQSGLEKPLRERRWAEP